MSSKGLKTIFRIGDDVTTSEIKGPNTIMFQTGDAATNSPGFEAESWQHVGFASRPSSISGSGDNALAAQALVIPRSDFDIVFATRDTRYQDIYGALKPGETCIYGTGADGTAQGRVLIKMDGSINMFTRKGNTADGKGMGFFINAASDSITGTNSLGSGIDINGDSAKLFTKAGSLGITASGIKLASKGVVNISGTSVVIGGPSAMAVLTVADLPAIFALIATALGAIPASAPLGGAPGAAALVAGQAAVIAAASVKRTSAE